MAQQDNFHHALKFKYDLCIGCSHCTSICPTAAIHIENDKPVLDPNRCIDCGRCYLICPVNAIYIEQDDFKTIYNYKHPVLLLPSIFSAQFPEKINQRAILSAIYHLGFKDVFEVEKSAEVLKTVMNSQSEKGHDNTRISSFCPAIVRLIQVKFPSLVPNLLRIKPPLDVTGNFIKKNLVAQGIPEEDIGIFYVAPCAAKIAAIKSPVGEDKSPINGVINMNYLYNKVFLTIKQGEYKLRDEYDFSSITKESLLWPLTGGEVNLLKEGRNLAIDEVHNVSDFLEKFENEDIDDIDFLELRACDESCAGGILCAGNRFLIAERQRKRAKNAADELKAEDNPLFAYMTELIDNIGVGEIFPRSMDKLDDDISIAMRKMKKVFEINASLPQVDCRICGYQSCKELATAIVNNKATIEQCFFVQCVLEQVGKMSKHEMLKIVKSIWGDMKFEKVNQCLD